MSRGLKHLSRLNALTSHRRLTPESRAPDPTLSLRPFSFLLDFGRLLIYRGNFIILTSIYLCFPSYANHNPLLIVSSHFLLYFAFTYQVFSFSFCILSIYNPICNCRFTFSLHTFYYIWLYFLFPISYLRNKNVLFFTHLRTILHLLFFRPCSDFLLFFNLPL